jgi:hypothetical protein
MYSRSNIFPVALLAAMIPFAARADDPGMKVMGHFGVWTSLAGTAQDGKPMCAIGMAKDAKGREIYIKYYPETDIIAFQVWKDSWEIPTNKEILVDVQINGGKAHSIMGLGLPDANGDGIESDLFLSGSFRTDTLQFIGEIKAGQEAKISFPDGSEGAWTLGINGATAAVESFLSCARMIAPGHDLDADAVEKTQPFASTSKYPEQVVANMHAGCMAPKNWQSRGIPRPLMEFMCDCFVEETQKAISLDEFIFWEQASRQGGDLNEGVKAINNKSEKAKQICKTRVENSGLLEKYRRN